MVLKGLFSRVINLARGVGEPSSNAEASPLPGSVSEEPIRTRTMAELLVQQGHVERAIAIYRELDGEHTRLAQLERRLGLERRASASKRDGVTLIRDGGLCAIAWQIDDDGLARARALGGDGRLALRTVRIVPVEGSVPRREQADDEATGPDGIMIVEAPTEARVVVSVGLLCGERFVSIAHASD